MTVEPANLAETPQREARTSRLPNEVDALSAILDAIHLRGDQVLHHNYEQPREISHLSGVRLVHIVEHGELTLLFDGEESEQILHFGDMALVPHGNGHTLISQGAASWVTGSFLLDEAVASTLFSVLPANVVIRGSKGDNSWLTVSLNLLLLEVASGRPGAQVMISRILDLIFIHALRAWAADGDASPGWLTAAMDSALGRALNAIHRDPQHRWTVNELAQCANLSRSAFASRFTRLLGTPPATYLAERRLGQAAYLLQSTTYSVGQVADQVGYTSEAAFSRAFHRHFGSPPRLWSVTTSPEV